MIVKSLALPSLNVSKNFWISLGVIFFLYFVVTRLPAVWGAYALSRTGAVAMNGVSGTLWSGSASLVSVKVKEVDYSLGTLSWKLEPLSLLTLKPCVLVATQMDNQQFDGHVCFKGKSVIEIRDASLSFPAALVQPLLPLAIDGQFSLNLEKLEIGNSRLQHIRGKATWMEGKIYNGANWMALGGLGADLVDDGKNGLSAHIFDVNSPLKLDMVGNLPFPTGGSIRGSFAMPEAYSREINAGAWISMFAVPQANDPQGNLVYSVDLNF
jgi:general secretion pathway protein N